MTDDVAAVHKQIIHLESALSDRLERIEHGLMGDPEVGLDGMVKRVQRIEADNSSAAQVHEGIEARSREGDATLDKRITEEKAITDERLAKLEGKWKMAIGIAIGASVVSGASAASLTQLFP